jgi:hypothetical protein
MPPVVIIPSVVGEPAHTVITPVIAAGLAFTVIALMTIHPEPSEYVIVTLPAATPVTTPVEEPTIALVTALLVHTPPPMESVNVVESLVHTVDAPLIVLGAPLTVIVFVVSQPVSKV